MGNETHAGLPEGIAEILEQRPIRLGTRASPLAMAQARMTAAALRERWGLTEDQVELSPVVASGDRITDRPLADVGGKALWTRELDWSLGGGAIDLSVHSMKDVETVRPDAFHIAAMLPRADVRDVLLGATSIEALPQGARFGTSSPRRAAQIRSIRPDITTVLFRGNVATRIGKLQAGEADATLLAAAGLDRLGETLDGLVSARLDSDTWLPAPSQGAVGVEVRADDAPMRALIGGIDNAPTSICVRAERALLFALGGDCHSAVAALARMDGETVHLRAMLYSEDGAEHVAGEARFAPGDAQGPASLAAELLARAPETITRLFNPA
ncbi:hydroxymethylbilane synthase [Sphingomonas ursincola]|uniref:Porphobilinogen deaminase n=1 Tax=Sphingomonas ursincola TaxID=56361 RepID=A0A7V8RGS9_9SPHN|nr:hydroxymethylbilane synthase [Sphingomonas ursincola]MBA1376181.1 hydroxymethylbilane synthase [Sphingomonas ursincola]